MPPVLHRTIPILRMFDVAKAREFYVEHLDENAPLFMGIARDGLALYLGAAKGYRYMNPSIQDQAWGTRELCVVDPSGNQVIFRERKAS